MNECKHDKIFYWIVNGVLCGGCTSCGRVIVGAVNMEGNPVGKQFKVKK